MATTAGMVALLLALGASFACPSFAQAAPVYYISLGDSLASGAQPDRQGHDHPTSAGYVDATRAGALAADAGPAFATQACDRPSASRAT